MSNRKDLIKDIIKCFDAGGAGPVQQRWQVHPALKCLVRRAYKTLASAVYPLRLQGVLKNYGCLSFILHSRLGFCWVAISQCQNLAQIYRCHHKAPIAASPAEGNEWRITIRYSINSVRYEKQPLMGHFITHGFNLGESVPIVINPNNHQQIQAAPFSPNVYFLAAALFSLLVIACYVVASR